MAISLDKKYQTRTGETVRLISDQGCDEDYPIVGYVGQACSIRYWSKQGLVSRSRTDEQDLVEATATVEINFWFNVYPNGKLGDSHHLKDTADKNGKHRIACINIKRTVKVGEGINE